MRERLVEERIEERICKIRVIDGVIANYYPQEELIRCKDCRWFLPSEGKSNGWCSFSQHGYPKADDYCSDAERKEEYETL